MRENIFFVAAATLGGLGGTRRAERTCVSRRRWPGWKKNKKRR